MAIDLFQRIEADKGPLGKWAEQAEGYYVFPKLEGPFLIECLLMVRK